MMLYELDDTEKEAIMGPWWEFTINLTLKVNRGSFGIKYERQGEFRFCAQSSEAARAVAGHYVKGSTGTIDTTRLVEVVSSIPVGR
jgi:hypothetical protein